MPPSAAPEWDRVGCSFETIATSAPASCAAMAARIPAQPAPTTRTSCSPITSSDATQNDAGGPTTSAVPSSPPCGYGQGMSDLSARFRAAYSLEQGDPAAMFFTARLLDDGLSEVRSDRWATSERSLAGLGEPLFRSAAPSQDTVVAWWEGALVHVMLQSGYVYAQVASADEETALKALGEIRERLPTPEPVARHDVPVTFWTYTPQGPMPSIRPIAVPEWDEIEANYAASTRAELASIMSGFRPSHGGQLILWHGGAGTGKTFALGAL